MKNKKVIWGSLLISVAVASPAWANTFRVGTGTGCTHSTIQAAVNAANASPGLDFIIITRSQSYTAQAVKIQQAQPLTILGGYATCTTTVPSGERTIVSGNGGSADSVFTIEPGAENVTLDNLFIRDGDDSNIHYGGGIDFTGSGELTLNNVTLTKNKAGYGGGLSARGTPEFATVRLTGETVINDNLATQDGGGVHLRGMVTLKALDPNITIWLNRATGLANTPPGTYHGYGGGMTVLSPARALIGSIGYGLGVFKDNIARAGGAVAALADAGLGNYFDSAPVKIFTTDPTKPQKVTGNRATDAGGAFYADAHVDGNISLFGEIRLWDTTIENNSAPIGSIAYLASDSPLLAGSAFSGWFTLNSLPGNGNVGSRPQDGVACNPGILCSVARNNRSEDATGNSSNGALIHGTEDAYVSIGTYRFTENSARSLLDLASARYVDVNNTLIDNNTFTAAAFQFPQGDPEVLLNHLTITDNIIGGPGVIAHRGHVELVRSIIWQPGKTVRDTAASSGTFDGAYVKANETASIPGVLYSYYPYPVGFMNPTLKDYRLRAGSALVDEIQRNSNLDDGLDLDGLPRSVNLPLVTVDHPVDLGAYERQSIGNIMVNDSFNSDLSQWTLPIPSLVSRDSNNGNGPGGSGSLKVLGSIFGTAASVTVAKQCQVLPGPSVYLVTGWGRSPSATMMSPGDGLRVHWKVFKPTHPAYGCTGLVIDEGDVVIPATTSWLVSPAGGEFAIKHIDYVSNAAVEISLVAHDVGFIDLQGFRHFDVAFDGLKLISDTIFANGFDQNE